MKNNEENTLISLAQNGDEIAFNTLIENNYMMIYKIAYKWCGIQEDAEDIAQDTCIKLARNLKNFRYESLFSTWIYKVTINTAKDHFKKRKNQKYDGYDDLDKFGFVTEASQEDNLMADELYKIIAELPEKQKDAFLLVMSEGFSHKEAGDILKCAEATISWRIFNAKKIIKKKILTHQNNEEGI